ncbi:MAG: AbrB/MazE/SpoVT family DNA-binding domain-containing protein [Oscillospiraceae bacterium]|nr:AbrB/MazE/SpoVT family DNA-binding domain-containing protein [Oscillospiraceae bacterium]
MGKQGIDRSMDDLGRVVIPRDIREEFGWGAGTKLEVVIKDVSVRSVTIRESTLRCSLCRQEAENLVKIEEGHICPQCSAKVS